MCVPLDVAGISMNGFEALLVYPVAGKFAIYLTQMSYFIRIVELEGFTIYGLRNSYI
jgi:hypothetical protein